MTYTIRNATVDDQKKLLDLLPRLADFEIPNNRTSDELWHGDRDVLLGWASGTRKDVSVQVAINSDNEVLGLAVISLRDELLSHAPSSHLEVLALAKTAEGQGIGRALLEAAQTSARSKGATSMSLHVFANNTRARGLYEKLGFSGELLRYYKPI